MGLLSIVSVHISPLVGLMVLLALLKARNRNPDEYYYAMASSKTKVVL